MSDDRLFIAVDHGFRLDVLKPTIPDPFHRVPEIAARLGVPEGTQGADHGLYLSMRDGRCYSFEALLLAFLDRLDAALPPEAKP